MKPEPAGDLVDLIASGAVQRDADRPMNVAHCSLCNAKGFTARSHASGHQQAYRRTRKK